MGRPEPCVLFSQSFVHPHLDEYVDESVVFLFYSYESWFIVLPLQLEYGFELNPNNLVIFAEPIVITACEFLEQNGSSASPMITLVGSFKTEKKLAIMLVEDYDVKVSSDSVYILQGYFTSFICFGGCVEAVVTNHLVVRGSYRSLTLVVYGNTAEDLGQFNIDFDLDSSLANLVSSPPEGKLEDLPAALNPSRSMFEQSISSLKSLSLPNAASDLSVEIKQFLHLSLKICQISNHEDTIQKLASIVASAVSSYVSSDLYGTAICWNQPKHSGITSSNKESQGVLTKARNELLDLFKMLQHGLENTTKELLADRVILESAATLSTSELLTYVFNHCFLFKGKFPGSERPLPYQIESMIVGLGMVLLLCSGRESCFHFIDVGGMEHVTHFLSHEAQRSATMTLMLLAIVECATRYAVGCEGFLGWWPRKDDNVPLDSSDGYSQLLKLLLQWQRHDVASLATYILQRLSLYEVASRYEVFAYRVLLSQQLLTAVYFLAVCNIVCAGRYLCCWEDYTYVFKFTCLRQLSAQKTLG
ncbi:hypothetical protein ACLOJK_013886 [Asimina triloba]